MKIGIPVDEPKLEAAVGQRFGLGRYMLVVDSETLAFEAVPNQGASAISQSGIQMVILAISSGVEAVITGYLSPTAQKHLTQNGIVVIGGIQGTASEALNSLKKDILERVSGERGEGEKITVDSFLLALRRSTGQFTALLPVMAGVILLIGLFQTFLSREMIAAVFSGKVLEDAFLGACLGSLLAGNAINSYVIGGGLLHQGISLFGVTSFMVAWVCVGLLQLPAEIATLGKRFSLVRIGLSFCLAMAVSISTSGLYYLIQG
jgi:predicted Fe-Mo cluster-binding NifX family protein